MKRYISLPIFLALFLFSFSAVNAQNMTLNPASVTKTVNEQFTVDLILDTQNKPIVGVDAKITYDPTIIEILGVTNGDFFDDGASNYSNSGTLYILGAFSQALRAETGTGKVATITLRGKKEGVDKLTFVCSTQTNDSNILDATSNDLIKCDGVKGGTYTFTSGSSGSEPTSTPGPTATPTTGSGTGRTPTPTPPVSGVSLPTIMSLGLGMLLTIIGIAVIF